MTEEVVRARRFELVDGDENVRGGMEVTEQGTARIHLRLPNGMGGVELNVEENGTANVALRDEQDRMRSRLSYRSLAAEAGAASVGIVFSDGDKDRAQFGLDPGSENPQMMLQDDEGREAVSIIVTRTAGTALTISDEHGNPRAGLALKPDGTPMLFPSK